MRVIATLDSYGYKRYNSEIYRTETKTGRVSTIKLANQYTERCERSAKRTSKRDSNGWRNPNPYMRTTLLMKSTGGSVVDTLEDGSTVTWTGDAGTGSTYHPVRYTGLLNADRSIDTSFNLMARADTEALVKVKDMRVNYGEALAESRSTIRHLARTSITLVRAYKYARSGQWHKVRKVLNLKKKDVLRGKSQANRWLEYQFGWTPLVNDIFGTYEQIQKGFRENEQRFSVVRTVNNGNGLPLLTGAFDKYTHYEGSSTLSVRTKLYCKVSNETLANLTSIGLTDPVQVAWALVPFSFLVDWVLPVSSFIEAAGAVKGVDFISGTRSHRLEFEFTAKSQPPFNQSKVVSREGYFTSEHRCLAVRRDVLTKFPSPLLYVKSPFSVSHAISAVALIRSLIK